MSVGLSRFYVHVHNIFHVFVFFVAFFHKNVKKNSMTTEEIKKRMKSMKISRSALAQRLHVSKGTVDNWLCDAAPIPRAKVDLIEMILSPEPEHNLTRTLEGLTPMGLLLTDAEYALISTVARNMGLTPDEYARRAILGEARKTASPDHE
ncbi:hypothetical protein ICN84_01475 [Akkermansia glycaniphila]|uniref:helix-turn-helix domain-containing protein n=1 Tax=Akkermansia glycaniphila TaxID=1679444 RepID=UPI001C0279F9|nr:hypothetical protein [Akkermansia glycaniphila]MBT9448740.1 hypothetical protein [Akkermansia glycaniphila]